MSQMQPEQNQTAPAAQSEGRNMIHVEHLKKNFNQLEILKDINIDVTEGEVVVIIGPSGSGKSTFLRCLNGLETATSGTVTVDGKDVSDKHTNMNKVRENIGMVFQHFNLFPHMNVLDNITLAPTELKTMTKEEAAAKGHELLRRVGLDEKAEVYPPQLSGGQKQRVAIVRALCMHPEILLFDEVTAALDPEMVREVLDVMLDLAKQGRTMIIVTHEMQFARAIANRVIFLDGGKIVEEAAPADFFDHPKTERAQRFLRTFTFDAVK